MAASVKHELDRQLRRLAALENDGQLRKRLLADADAIVHGRGRLSAHHIDLARKFGLT